MIENRLRLVGYNDLADKLIHVAKQGINIDDLWDKRLRQYNDMLSDKNIVSKIKEFVIELNIIKYIYDTEENELIGINKMIDSVGWSIKRVYLSLLALEGRHYKEKNYRISKQDTLAIMNYTCWYSLYNVGLFGISIEFEKVLKKGYVFNQFSIYKNDKLLKKIVLLSDNMSIVLDLPNTLIIGRAGDYKIDFDMPNKMLKFGEVLKEKCSILDLYC